ncbi:MAG: excinuclease ABC subunit UvrC [Acidobacteriota bacterium]
MNETSRTLQEMAAGLPEEPGVYQFRSARGTILYIGKAKSLRSRVRSYFQNPAGRSPRIRRMLAEAADLDIIIAGSEVEALILENQLIKKEQPRFNVLLRDDKSYPYLKLTGKDQFPRVVLTRRAVLDGHQYFGPYLPASSARRTLKLLAKWFRVATCWERLDGSRPRPCLYYHMNQCLGPCAGLVSEAEYGSAIRDSRLFLEGRNRELRKRLLEKMNRAAEAEEFERAAGYRDLIRTVDKQSERVGIRQVSLKDQDFMAIHREGERAVLLLFSLRNREIRSRREFRFPEVDLPDPEFLASALCQYFASGADIPMIITIDRPMADADWITLWLRQKSGHPVRVTVPGRGPRKLFLDTVRRNAQLAFATAFRALPQGLEDIEALRDELGLDGTPFHIEAFDISHTGGELPVASLVVWEGGKPKRGSYRRLRLRRVDGPDDYSAMAEAVGRRYSRLMREGRPLPDLILLDGGKGQLGAARRALREASVPPIPLAALAKGEDRIFLPDRSDPLPLDERSRVLHLVQRIRDEAHRFAHDYHVRLRKKALLTTSLTEVQGIGPATAKKLLRRFGSLQGVRRAPREDLLRELGRKLTERLQEHFRRPSGPEPASEG